MKAIVLLLNFIGTGVIHPLPDLTVIQIRMVIRLESSIHKYNKIVDFYTDLSAKKPDRKDICDEEIKFAKDHLKELRASRDKEIVRVLDGLFKIP